MRGREKLPMPFKKELVEQNKLGKIRKRGDSRLAFDTTLAKRWVHSRIGVPDTRTGWWLLHQQVSNDYCKQIVGEEWNEEEGKFKKVGENHYLDCEGMQYILALREKLHRRKRGVLTKAQLKAAIRVIEGAPLELEPESAAADSSVPASAVAVPEPEAVKPSAPPKRGGRFKINRK